MQVLLVHPHPLGELAFKQALMGEVLPCLSMCYTHLSAVDRETLSLDLDHGHSLRTIASVLGRAPSTVSRESARNATRRQPSRPCTAQTRVTAWARHPRRSRTLVNPWLWQYVRTHLAGAARPNRFVDSVPAVLDRPRRAV